MSIGSQKGLDSILESEEVEEDQTFEDIEDMIREEVEEHIIHEEVEEDMIRVGEEVGEDCAT